MKRRRWEEELERDFREHIDREIEENVARGMNLEEAKYAAHRKFGNIALLKEETRYVWSSRWLSELSQDVRYALRIVRKSPAFAATAVISIALGIGANTAIFSLIDSLLLRRLPVSAPERLVHVGLWVRGHSQAYVTTPIFRAIQKRNEVFAQTFAWGDHEFQTPVNGETVKVQGVIASGDYFQGLGASAEAGRTFTSDDDRSGGGADGPVVVISDAFWARQFQREKAAIGRAITLDHVRFTIIGVMPRSFFGAQPGSAPDIWAPLETGNQIGESRCLTSRSCWFLAVMARLKPGVTESSAAANLRVISPELMKATMPEKWSSEQRKWFLSMSLQLDPGAAGFSPLRLRFSNPLAVLMILVGLVLLIACTNLANLLLARSAARQHETAVRLAIGAGRWRLIRQLLTESVVMSVAGAALGMAFAMWSVRVLVGFLQVRSTPIMLNLNPDWRVLLFTGSAAILTGLLFGIFPALQSTRFGISFGLKNSAKNQLGARERRRAARFLLAAQVAMSVVLAASAGLFGGTLLRLWMMNPGFNPRHLSVIGIDTDRSPRKGAALVGIYSRLLERVRSFPGVRSASVLLITPTTNSVWDDDVSIPGGRELPPADRDAMVNLVGPHYFETMQTPLLAGREFTDDDTAAAEKTGIISAKAARAWFGERSPIGEHISFQNSIIRVIGVAADAKYLDLRQPDPLALYLSYRQNESPGSLSFAVRTEGGSTGVYPAFRAAAKEIAPGIPVGAMKSMEEQIKGSLGQERLMGSLSIFFGVLALLLACIGLYGILAYSVARRTGEIGVRLALGASRADVIWLVVREEVGLVLAGSSLGVAATLATSHFVAGFLYGVKPNDPRVIGAAVGALLIVSLAAAWFPALRAARLDPTAALRED